MLLQWHVKDPGHSAQSAGCRLHLNMYTPLTQRSRSRLTMPLSRHCVGTCLETSSHATCQGTFCHGHPSSLSHCARIDPGIKSGISVRKLISTSKKLPHTHTHTKRQAWNEWSNVLPKCLQVRKKPPILCGGLGSKYQLTN